MILSFRHRGLRDLHEGRGAGGVTPEHLRKLRRILADLDDSRTPQEMNRPGYQLHQLTGRLRGNYAVSVSANWRVTFRVENGDIFDVDYLDYH